MCARSWINLLWIWTSIRKGSNMNWKSQESIKSICLGFQWSQKLSFILSEDVYTCWAQTWKTTPEQYKRSFKRINISLEFYICLTQLYIFQGTVYTCWAQAWKSLLKSCKIQKTYWKNIKLKGSIKSMFWDSRRQNQWFWALAQNPY